MGRWLIWLIFVAFCCIGCSSTPGPLQKLPNPLGGLSKDQKLRKQVEADKFPSAKQVGL
jgi:hypothetical protein